MQNVLNDSSYPFATAGWRTNFKALAPMTATSPLPTRQLRRATARALAKQLATETKRRSRKGKHGRGA